jgi:hypothetical protein
VKLSVGCANPVTEERRKAIHTSVFIIADFFLSQQHINGKEVRRWVATP